MSEGRCGLVAVAFEEPQPVSEYPTPKRIEKIEIEITTLFILYCKAYPFDEMVLILPISGRDFSVYKNNECKHL